MIYVMCYPSPESRRTKEHTQLDVTVLVRGTHVVYPSVASSWACFRYAALGRNAWGG